MRVSFFLRDRNRTLDEQLSNFELYLMRVKVPLRECLSNCTNTLAVSHRCVCVCRGVEGEGEGGGALRQLCPLKATTLC